MGRICYESIVRCFNEEHEKQGSDKARPDLIPQGEKFRYLDEATKMLLNDDDTGLLEKVFGCQTRVSSIVFAEQLQKNCYHFLEPHRIRSLVHSELLE